MKKNLIILLVLSLLLVLAVSCSDSSKYGTLEIDTKLAKEVIEAEDCNGAWLAIDDDLNPNRECDIYLNFKDVKKGTVRVDLPIGVYQNMFLCVGKDGDEKDNFGLVHVAKTKEGHKSLYQFVINPNDTTYCELEIPR